MKITFISRGISKSEALERDIEKGLKRVGDYFGDSAECRVVYRQEGRVKVCELTIVRRGDVFRCEKEHEDIFVAANDAIDTLWRKIRKYKSKIDKLRREKYESKLEFHTAQFDTKELQGQDIGDVKNKKVKPDVMSVAEAAAALDLVGHDFYIFVNEETDTVSVIYKRNTNKHGDSYGVIEVNE